VADSSCFRQSFGPLATSGHCGSVSFRRLRANFFYPRHILIPSQRTRTSMLALLLLLVFTSFSSPSFAQYHRNDSFHRGAYQGGHGNYYGHGHSYDNRNDHSGGIGPGKGALIGGAGGAVLGAVFGGGAKGALIGGAAGAGIGAIAGQANQNNRRRNDYRR
jgi:hypothetical protein